MDAGGQDYCQPGQPGILAAAMGLTSAEECGMRGGVRRREWPLSRRSGGRGGLGGYVMYRQRALPAQPRPPDGYFHIPSVGVRGVCTHPLPTLSSLPRKCVPNPGGTPRAARSKLTPQQISACQFLRHPSLIACVCSNKCTHRQRTRISICQAYLTTPLTPCPVFCNQDGQLVSSSCLSISLKSRPTNWILSRQWEKETRSRTCDQYQRG